MEKQIEKMSKIERDLFNASLEFLDSLDLNGSFEATISRNSAINASEIKIKHSPERFPEDKYEIKLVMWKYNLTFWEEDNTNSDYREFIYKKFEKKLVRNPVDENVLLIKPEYHEKSMFE